MYHPTQRDLTTGEAADLMRLSRAIVIRLCREDRLPHYHIPGSSHRRLRRQDVLDYMTAQGIPQAPPTPTEVSGSV